MTRIDAARTRLHEDHDCIGPRPLVPDVARAYARIVDAPEYLAFLCELGEPPKGDALAKARLDGFRARFSGPYLVAGKAVDARPMFRMNGGFNERQKNAHDRELRAVCVKAGVGGEAVMRAQLGRGTPEELVKVTQALIDAGKLPPGGDSAELRIRQMQWSWGIGVDCAGYTEQAAAAARGDVVARPSMNDFLAEMRARGAAKRIDVSQLRPGDVIRLNSPSPGEPGHDVVVYAHDVATSVQGMTGPGPFHVIEVDSSWGAGDGNDFGGFRRDTWIYDEGTHTWGSYEHGSGAFGVSSRGPCDEPFGGAFRAKEPR